MSILENDRVVAAIMLVALSITFASVLCFGFLSPDTHPHRTENVELDDVMASITLTTNITFVLNTDDNYYTQAEITFRDSAGYDIEYSNFDGGIELTHMNLESEKYPPVISNHLIIYLPGTPGDYYIALTNLERGTNQTLNFTIDNDLALGVEP